MLNYFVLMVIAGNDRKRTTVVDNWKKLHVIPHYFMSDEKIVP